MIPRYSTPEMTEVWSDTSKWGRYLEVELLATEAHAEIGVVPNDDAAACRSNAPTADDAFVEAILEREAVTDHDVAAFVDVVQSAIIDRGGADAADAAKWIHYGMTSSDVGDTVLCWQLRDAADILLAEIDRLIEVLVGLAREHRDTVMIGRTHGVHAEPTTFGAKLALWPGQSRGGYKGHGGFWFDSSDADSIIVRAPVGGHLVQAARYLEGTEEQVLLFFSVPCGFFYRFDHVSGLSPKIEDALKVITGPATNDSRTTFMSPPLWVEQGEIVGTSVGIPPSNIFPNNVIPNPAWADSFANDKEFGHYGVCFFDYLPSEDGDLMRSLPTGKEGKTSDYC